MGKLKSNSSAIEQRRRKKLKAPSIVQSNPFEVRVNKEKYSILGRKLKHDKGLPGLSRSKAIKKRKKTLLQEYKQGNKSSLFIDKRFGEYNNDLSLEEKMLQRFTLEKQKHHESRGLYNLDDEEDLTHYGQSLGDLDNFDDADLKLTDDEEEEEIIDDTHFGGFLERSDRPYGEKAGEPKSKKEIMEEVVAKSKLKKMERQQAQEEAFQLTQDLDTDWRVIQSLLPKREDTVHTKADDYDVLVRQLMYEKKATPTDRLKTEEEIAKAEMDKLQNLEEERLQRMHAKEAKKGSHFSADYLGEKHAPVTDKRVELIYKDGKMVLPEGADLMEGDESGSDEDESINEEEDDEDIEEEDQMSDEDGSDASSSDDQQKKSTLKIGKTNGATLENNKDTKKKTQLKSESEKNLRKDAENKSSKIKDAEKELPFTFAAPKDLKEFLECVEGWNYDQQLCIIDRIRKCHPPKLDEKNRKKMEAMLCVVLNYIEHLCDQSPIPMEFINKLAKPVFELANDSPYHAAREIQKRLRLMFKRFWVRGQNSGGRNITPGVKEIIFLAIIATVFPTSDLRHGVTTPALVYMAAVLSKSYFQTSADLLSGLFIANRIYEFVSLSKRFVPEVINFLSGVLSMSTKKEDDFKYPLLFKVHTKSQNCLLLESSLKSTVPCKAKLSDVATLKNEDLRNTTANFKLQSIRTCLHMIKQFVELYKEQPSFNDMFTPVKACIDKIPIDHYPQSIQEQFAELIQLLNVSTTNWQPLTLQSRKPVPLPLLEPKFDERYEVKAKRKFMNKDANEREKLKYKHKKEMKGAIRELRKDSQFLAKEKLQEKLTRDAERNRKTREIEGQLAAQQGDMNAFDKIKRKKKR